MFFFLVLLEGPNLTSCCWFSPSGFSSSPAGLKGWENHEYTLAKTPDLETRWKQCPHNTAYATLLKLLVWEGLVKAEGFNGYNGVINNDE